MSIKLYQMMSKSVTPSPLYLTSTRSVCRMIQCVPYKKHQHKQNKYQRDIKTYPKTHIKTQASLLSDLDTIATTAHFTAKGVILFTMFYCSLNYMYYRKINKEIDERNKDTKDKNKDGKP